MMKNYDQSVEISQNPNWPYIPPHPYTAHSLTKQITDRSISVCKISLS